MFSALSLAVSPTPPVNAESAAVLPVITVDTRVTRGDVSPYLRSANHRFAYGGFGVYDKDNNRVYEDFTQKNKAANWGSVRYPGGTIANLFKWKDTIGSKEQRKNIVLGSDFSTDFPDYGVDEHMRFCEEIGAKATYMIGEASETPQDAADLVEYLNAPNDGSNPGGGVDWAAERAANGHPEPYNVKYFEIGNEMHIGNQRYWTKYPSAASSSTPHGDADFVGKYAQGDTVAIPKDPIDNDALVNGTSAREYGTWNKNISKGTSGQKFYTQYAPVEPKSQTVYVDDLPWSKADDMSAMAADAQVYAFDDKTGEITFGDGVHGKIPPAGTKITISYNHVHAGFAAYYDAMKAVDPSVKIVSCFENIYAAFDRLGLDASKCDGIAYHDYKNMPDGANTKEKLYDNWQTLSDELVQDMQNDVTEVRTASKNNDAIAAVTEFGTINVPGLNGSANDEKKDEARTLARGISLATMYIGAATAGIDTLTHQGYTAYSFGGGAALPRAGKVYNSLYAQDPSDESKTIESAMVLSYNLMGRYTAGKLLDSYIERNPVTAKSKSYESLRVLATKDGGDADAGDVCAIVVNRDPEKDITTTINLRGMEIADEEIEITTLNADSYNDCNTPDHPTDVKLTDTSHKMGVGAKGTNTVAGATGGYNGATFTYTFPAHSVVGIRIKAKSSAAHWDNSSFKNPSGLSWEGVAIGNMPANVETVGAASDGKATVQSVPVGSPASVGAKALRLVRGASDNTQVRAALSGQPMTGGPYTQFAKMLRVTMDICPMQTDSRLNILVKSGNGEIATNISFDASGYIKTNGKEHKLYASGQWYRVEIVLDHAAKRNYIYIDGELVTNTIRQYNNNLTSGLEYLYFDLENKAGTFYMDNYLVRTSNNDIEKAITQSELVTVSTRVNSAPELPEKVNLLYNTGEKEEHSVAWKKIDPAEYQSIKTFCVEGIISGSELTAKAYVDVVDAVSVDAVKVSTKVNQAPVLPETVALRYSDRSTRQTKVVWDAIAPFQYSEPGVFSVNGMLEGCALKATATITVRALTQAEKNLEAAVGAIGGIADADQITAANAAVQKAKVQAAREAYDKLTAEQKREFPAGLLKKLADAETKILKLLSEVKAETVFLSKTSLELQINKVFKLSASVAPKNADGTVVWKTSNSKIVSVDQSGNIKAAAVGTAVISAEIDGKTAKCTVKIFKPSVLSVKIKKGKRVVNGKKITVKKKSKRVKLTAKLTVKGVLPASKRRVTWSTANKKIAKVKNGVVTFKKKGIVKITAKSGGKKAVVRIKIK